jgi:hypothetical protein
MSKLAAYSRPADHFEDYVDLVLLLVKRYVARHGHRMVLRDGTLSDLYVTFMEGRAALGMPLDAHNEPLAAREGWPRAAEVDREIVARAREIERRASQTKDLPLPRLRLACGLTESEVRLLIAAAAPQYSMDAARLYTLAWSDFTVRRPTVGFLAELVSDDPRQVRARVRDLRDGGPLRATGLLIVSDTDPQGRPAPELHRSVHVADSVLRFLEGPLDGLPAHLRERAELSDLGAVTPRAKLLMNERTEKEISDAIAHALRDMNGRPRPILLGARGLGRRSFLTALLADEKRPVLTADLSRLEDARFSEGLAELFREALLNDALLLLRADDFFTDGPRAARLLPQLGSAVNGHAGLVAFTAAEPFGPLARHVTGLLEIPVPYPTTDQQEQVWQAAFAAIRSPSPELAAQLVGRFSLTPGSIHTAVRDAHGRAMMTAGRRDVKLTAQDIGSSVRRRLDHALSLVAEPVVTTLTWDDVVLPEHTAEALHRIEDQARFRRVVYDDWGFRRKISYGQGLTCLFAGPPGTGKTMMAGVIANSLGRELYRVDLSRISSKWIGETEKNLARLFDEAESAQVVLLFDEADSLFASRTRVETANDRFANSLVNYLLQRMEAFDGITILTTNLERELDEAFSRRIKIRVFFELPSAGERAKLWKSVVPTEAHAEAEIDWRALGSTFQMAGGHIKNAVLRAAFQAAREGAALSFKHLHEAALAEADDIGLVVNK